LQYTHNIFKNMAVILKYNSYTIDQPKIC